MALKSTPNGSDPAIATEDLLEQLEKLMERLKVMYEQYFMGIQKIAPAQLHSEAERRLRDLTQVSIRNTALRYRFNSLQQKYGSYNSYWRRTLREIEQGRYVRSLQRLSRQAARDGVALPEEILAAMPKRMREQVQRDREAAVAMAKRRDGEKTNQAPSPDTEADAFGTFAGEAGATIISPKPNLSPRDTRGNFLLSEEDADLDLESLFSGFGNTDATVHSGPPSAMAAMMATRGPQAANAAAPRTTKPPPLPPPPPRRASIAPAIQPVAADLHASAATPASAPARILSARTETGVAPSAAPSPARVPRASTEIGVTPVAAAARVPRAPAEIGGPAGPRQPRAGTVVGPGTAPRNATFQAAAVGMTDAEVRSLYNNYVKARTLVGEKSDANTYAKLMKTIAQQGPKIMEQYKSKGVEFGVVVKDNQVILKAKPK
ncbi:MAG: hypothetical protein KBG15_08070 [Kofleriaceae bacterium]|nr:hypothetical protein [Kofleriaceae bacterium]